MEMKLTAFTLRHALAAVVLFTLINSALALQCVICNSTQNPNCPEIFDHQSGIIQTMKKDCDMWNAKYCVKVTGMWGGMVGSYRFCSARDMGLQCQDVWFPDHDRMYHACVYTCNGDNCNSATTMSFTAVGVVIAGWLLHHLQHLV